jgi:hypothetical protein
MQGGGKASKEASWWSWTMMTTQRIPNVGTKIKKNNFLLDPQASIENLERDSLTQRSNHRRLNHSWQKPGVLLEDSPVLEFPATMNELISTILHGPKLTTKDTSDDEKQE